MLRSILKKIPFAELIILFGVLLLINNYLGEEKRIIKSDGRGYYDYLPGIFIYEDINFAYYDTLNIENCDKGESFGLMKDFKGKKVSKYPIGSALLWTPFFLYSHTSATLSNEFSADGYSFPYQKGIYFASLFYLFLGLVFLRKLLLFYDLSRIRIFLAQVFIVFGSPLIHYVYYDASFSHINSFFAITLFLYLIKNYLVYNNLKTLFFAGLVLGLIVLIRQVNLLVIFAVPFLIGDLSKIKVFLEEHLYRKVYKTLLFVLGIVIVVFIQLLFNKLQSGYFIVYSYGEEGFNFLEPKFFESWFGFGKGFFIYTPVAFVGVIGVVLYSVKNRMWMLLISYILFLALVNYIFSSWWCWYYGGSYSLRPWTDFLSFFALGILFILNIKYLKFLILPVLIVLSYINIIQVYQYKNYILPWGEIGYENYKKVFLQTDPRYQGYFFRRNIKIEDFSMISSFNTDDTFIVEKESGKVVLTKTDSLLQYDKLNLARIELDKTLEDDYKVVLIIRSNLGDDVVYYHSQWYFHHFDKEQSDKVYLDYCFADNLFIDKQPLSFEVRIETQESLVKTTGVKLGLFKLKND